MRPPRDLHQRYRNSGLSCVLANVLHMYETHHEPTTIWVDRQIRRNANEAGDITRAQLFLLREGYSQHEIGAFSSERLIAEGIDYLRAFYGSQWTPVWEEYWSQSDRLEELRQMHLRARQLRGRVQMDYREPMLTDIRHALEQKRLVMITVDNDREDLSCQAALVYGIEGSSFLVYVPEYSGRSCLQAYTARQLTREWLQTEGILTVWR